MQNNARMRTKIRYVKNAMVTRAKFRNANYGNAVAAAMTAKNKTDMAVAKQFCVLSRPQCQ